ncbi:MAG: hypothetical protein IJC50_07305 [Clostridia bacterium]|nr:hypothetical protein [Clostridia bacterium]
MFDKRCTSNYESGSSDIGGAGSAHIFYIGYAKAGVDMSAAKIGGGGRESRFFPFPDGIFYGKG